MRRNLTQAIFLRILCRGNRREAKEKLGAERLTHGRRNALELAEEAEVVFVEPSDVGDVVFAHGERFDFAGPSVR